MKRSASTIILLFTMFICAKSQNIVHFNFGKTGNVTYAVAPEKIKSQNKKEELTAIGRPVFYADAPDSKARKGEGSILFSGKKEGYKIPHSLGVPSENQILEVWVKARDINQQDKTITPIVSNGSLKNGYTIAQRGDKWVLVSGDSKVTSIAPIIKGEWAHLAATLYNEKGEIWFNGRKTGEFKPTKTFDQNFSVATCDDCENSFYGEIHELKFTSGFKTFNPESDFLLDYKKKIQQGQNRVAERKKLIANLEKEGLGKETVSKLPYNTQKNDWLITEIKDPCKLFVEKSTDGLTSKIQLNNGLVSRTFYIAENLACIEYKNLSNDTEYLRAVKPEARVMINSTWYEVGGLKGQPELSYLLESWYPTLENNDFAFVLTHVETGSPLKRYPWQAKYNAVDTEWPAKGLRVEMTYSTPPSVSILKDVQVKVIYEIYQGMPVIVKWIEVLNASDTNVKLNQIESEVLAVNQDQINHIHVESDFSFALVNANIKGSALMHYHGDKIEPYQAGESTTLWTVDEDYHTWATHNQAEDNFLEFPHRNLLKSRLPMGPDVQVSKSKPFKSYLTFELLQDSDDRERKSLGHRRMYKKLAPQTTESLICGGITSHDEKKLKNFIDQMAELGMERLDIQAWPGVSHDNLEKDYVALWTEIAGYAKARGIIMGGYELQIASRGRAKEVDCIDPKTGKQGSIFGQSVCIASDWKDTYYNNMWQFYDKTGFMTYNMDGPYHGDPCASTEHKYHTGLYDSQWEQWKTQVEVIHELQRRNIYIPIPDWYFLNGQSATGMGYREASSNLTPEQQMLLGRQYIYDGTWHKLPTMGWIGMQLVGFYTNDPKVGLEPLSENLGRYEQQLIQFLASGCQFTIRGNRLYDTPATKAMISKWINWFKKHREILTSEIIHVSRPNGRDLDCMLHANPFIKEKGMIVIFNPTNNERHEIAFVLYRIKGKS